MKTFPFTKTYNSVRVLDYPGYEFESGKIYAVIGANGSGKSTLAKILSGVEKPDSGRTVADVSGVGYMPQKSYAFRLSTEKNILLNGGDRERAKELIEKLRLGNLKHRKAHRLPEGETARMALARILMREYKLLIPDEPTAAMDMESTAASEELIRDYSGRYACPRGAYYSQHNSGRDACGLRALLLKGNFDGGRTRGQASEAPQQS